MAGLKHARKQSAANQAAGRPDEPQAKKVTAAPPVRVEVAPAPVAAAPVVVAPVPPSPTVAPAVPAETGAAPEVSPFVMTTTGHAPLVQHTDAPLVTKEEEHRDE